MKKCSRCKQVLPVSEFYRSGLTKDRIQTYCKKCFSEYNKERRLLRGPRPPAQTGEKRCSRCRVTKPIANFAINKWNKDGRDWYCKPCKVIRAREERERDPEKVRRYNREFRLACYGLTTEAFDAMVKKQRGICAICGDAPNGQFHIDHCHDSGRVRGLLCWRCNSSIGKFNDDPVLLRKAAAYLERGAKPR